MWNVFSEETIRMLFATDCLCGLVRIDCTDFYGTMERNQYEPTNMPYLGHEYQWIGLRENLQESPICFMGKSMVSCKNALKPIQSKYQYIFATYELQC